MPSFIDRAATTVLTHCKSLDIMVHALFCSAFYERLKEVRDYHRRYPYLEVVEVSISLYINPGMCTDTHVIVKPCLLQGLTSQLYPATPFESFDAKACVHHHAGYSRGGGT